MFACVLFANLLVFAASASAHERIRQSAAPAEKHPWFGSVVASLGRDRDGTAEFLVADPGVYKQRGAVWVVSAKDGRARHVVFGEAPGDGFGIDVRSAGDVDKDGHIDWIVGAGSRYSPKDVSGYAVVFSGATGKPIHRFACRAKGDGFGSTVSGCGDVDHDGYADLVVGAYDADGKADAMGVAYIFSGRDGSLLRVLGPHSSPLERGIEVSGVGDVNGDGFDDVAVSVHDESAPAHAPHAVRVYSGKDGSLLYAVASPSSYPIHVVRSAGDADGDGRPDILVGAIGGAALVSGRSGRAIHTWTGSIDEQFGWAVAALRHAGSEPRVDLLVTAPDAIVWGGRVDRFSASTGERIDRFDAAEDVHHLGISIDSLGDVDGDGWDDYVVGTDHSGAAEDGFAEVRSGRGGALMLELRRRGDALTAR
jgi:hypothetical protein